MRNITVIIVTTVRTAATTRLDRRARVVVAATLVHGRVVADPSLSARVDRDRGHVRTAQPDDATVRRSHETSFDRVVRSRVTLFAIRTPGTGRDELVGREPRTPCSCARHTTDERREKRRDERREKRRRRRRQRGRGATRRDDATRRRDETTRRDDESGGGGRARSASPSVCLGLGAPTAKGSARHARTRARGEGRGAPNRRARSVARARLPSPPLAPPPRYTTVYRTILSFAALLAPPPRAI